MWRTTMFATRSMRACIHAVGKYGVDGRASSNAVGAVMPCNRACTCDSANRVALEAMVKAGATRIGASAGVRIVQQATGGKVTGEVKGY